MALQMKPKTFNPYKNDFYTFLKINCLIDFDFNANKNSPTRNKIDVYRIKTMATPFDNLEHKSGKECTNILIEKKSNEHTKTQWNFIN